MRSAREPSGARHGVGLACLLGLCAGLAAALPLAAHGVTLPEDLCLGDPCVITTNHTVDDDSDVDFGTRAVVLRAVLTVGDSLDSVTGDSLGPGLITLRAGSFRIEGGGRIKGQGGQTFDGGTVRIITLGNIEIERTGSGFAFLLTGAFGGELELSSTRGSILATGKIMKLTNTTIEGDGGYLTIVTEDPNGVVDLRGSILASGGTQGSGGEIDISSAGALTILDAGLAGVDLSGGDFDGGFLTLVAGGRITLGRILANGGSESGLGGSLDVLARGPIIVNGPIDALGAQGVLGGGEGGELILDTTDLFAPSEPVKILGPIRLNGRGPDGDGGFLTIWGSTVELNAPIELTGQDFADLDVGADESLSVTAPITLSSGSFCDLTSDGAIALHAPIDASGAAGGLISVAAQGSLDIATSLRANATSSSSFAGDIDLEGCQVTVAAGSALQVLGNTGTITITSHDRMTLAGEFTADPGTGSIELEYRDAARPPLVAAASFSPAAGLFLLPNLLPCGGGIPDSDGDGVFDDLDNCPFQPNSPQRPSLDDPAIGAACLCGDLDGDGTLQASDELVLRRFLSGVIPVLPNPRKCSVTGGPADCDMADVAVMGRAVAGLSPGPAQVCAAALP